MKRTVNLSIISILTAVGCVGMTSIAQARDITQSLETSLPETTLLAQGGGGPRLPIPQGPQNPSQDAAVRGQIAQLYSLILNRAPDDFGMNYYLGRYYNGMTIDQIRQELSNSEEARRARAEAISRSNDERDRRYNSGRFDNDHYNNGRYDNRYSQDNVRSQINGIYRRILNRNADNFGMNYYLERYNNDGWSLDRISQHIWDSDEARDLRGW